MPPYLIEPNHERSLRRYEWDSSVTRNKHADFNSSISTFSFTLAPESTAKFAARRRLSQELQARRKVSFSVVRTALLHSVPPASLMTEEEKNIIWWDAEEIMHFKDTTEKMLKTMLLRPAIRDVASAYPSVIKNVYEACHDARSDDFRIEEADSKLLSDWLSKSHCRRGLEGRFLESNTRNIVLHAVNVLYSNENIKDSIKAENIRVCSERLTRPARLFAKTMAHADEECVKAQRKRTSRRRQ